MEPNTRNPEYKASLVREILLPMIGPLSEAETETLFAYFVQISRLRYAVRDQYLDEPGPFEDGNALLLPHSISHSFFNYSDDKLIGTRIWLRKSVIFNAGSLLDGTKREEYVQVLEAGPYLSIRYPDLRQLIREHPLVELAIHNWSRINQRYYERHHQILGLKSLPRVAQFEMENKAFVHCANIHQRCIHVNLTRQTYSALLKKINEQNNKKNDD